MRSLVIRRALAFFLPVAVLATLCCGLVYGAVQQDLRMGANDPQLQLAEDAARALDAGAPAATLVGSVHGRCGRQPRPVHRDLRPLRARPRD